MKKTVLSILIALASIAAQPSFAEVNPIAMPGDTKLVVFNYDQNNTYSILTTPGMITDIELGPDEKLSAMAFGDSIQWITADADGHIFVKPTVTGLTTSATIVTSKRSYQLTFRSVSEGEKWYQRVSWHYPQILLMKKEEEKKAQEVEVEKKQQQEEQVVNPDANVTALNFDYSVEGDAPFKPDQVFDDGTFTYIKISQKSQEMPALFILNSDGQAELANYVVKGNYMMLQRIAEKILLKLGHDEIKITKKKKSKSWW